VRVEALLSLMRQRGYEWDVRLRPRGMLARRRLLQSADRYYAVLLQRKLLDPGDAQLLRQSARSIFYDVDDAVMHHNRPVGWVKRWRTQRRFRATVQIIDHVVAGNEHLAGIFRANGASASVLRTVVDPARYLVKTHRPTDAPALVWIGSRSTLPYLRECLKAIECAARRVAGLRLVTISDESINNVPFAVDHVPWSIAGEALALLNGDIGIAPTPTNPWTLGKCGFKIVQYMAAGLPVIASPVGANVDLVRGSGSGYLPCSHDEWVEAIVRLAQDAKLREGMGYAGRARVERELCLAQAADKWARLLDDVQSPVPAAGMTST
jgi:glycosyltransferase involved in cell wall biosynthesis